MPKAISLVAEPARPAFVPFINGLRQGAWTCGKWALAAMAVSTPLALLVAPIAAPYLLMGFGAMASFAAHLWGGAEIVRHSVPARSQEVIASKPLLPSYKLGSAFAALASLAAGCGVVYQLHTFVPPPPDPKMPPPIRLFGPMP